MTHSLELGRKWVLAGEIRPIDDVRSTAAYRLRVAGNLLRQWWEETD